MGLIRGEVPSTAPETACQTWAAGPRRACQSAAVTEGAGGAGGAVAEGRPAS